MLRNTSATILYAFGGIILSLSGLFLWRAFDASPTDPTQLVEGVKRTERSSKSSSAILNDGGTGQVGREFQVQVPVRDGEGQQDIEQLRQLAKTAPRAMADSMPQWIDGLIDSGHFADAQELALIALQEKAFDISTVEKAQQSRVLAFMRLGKFDAALIEAKSYYNVATLGASNSAIELLLQVLEKTHGAHMAALFRAEQAGRGTSLATSETKSEGSGSSTSQVITAAPELLTNQISVLRSIQVNSQPYEDAIADLQGRRPSSGNLRARGNLLLLADRPNDARQCFEMACKLPGNTGKTLREAVEGIARSIRASECSLVPANEFVLSLRGESALTSKLVQPADRENLRVAAQMTVIGTIQSMLAPPLELARIAHDSGNNSSPLPKLVTGFAGSTPIDIRPLSATHFEVTLKTEGLLNWFMFRLEGVADRTIRIDIRNGSLVKWSTLNPVFSYASDLSDLSAFSSNERTSSTKSAIAWNGPELADTSGQQWHYIADVWRGDGTVTSFVHHFSEHTVYIAMRVPYTAEYNERYLASLNGRTDVKIHTVGVSPKGKQLQVVEIGKNQNAQSPCILVYAREHPSEQDSSWVAQGIIEYLLSDALKVTDARSRMTFLIVPMLDPDGAMDGIYERITKAFVSASPSPEAEAYGRFMLKWITDEKRLDLVLNLHNIESAESDRHLFCPLIVAERELPSAFAAFNAALMTRLVAQGYAVINTIPNQKIDSRSRFGGWLSYQFGALHMLYEANSQAPSRHLNLAQLRELGACVVQALDEFIGSPAGSELFVNISKSRKVVKLNREKPRRLDAGLNNPDPFWVGEAIGLQGSQ